MTMSLKFLQSLPASAPVMFASELLRPPHLMIPKSESYSSLTLLADLPVSLART
jgi:hypothetical protein